MSGHCVLCDRTLAPYFGMGFPFSPHYVILCGRDEFSSQRGEALAAKVLDEVIRAITEALRPDENEEFVAKVYRWYLRGLPPALALRKCRVDAEVAANVKSQLK